MSILSASRNAYSEQPDIDGVNFLLDVRAIARFQKFRLLANRVAPRDQAVTGERDNGIAKGAGELIVRKREWLRCSDAERMIKPLWVLGDHNLIGPRPFFFFVLTAGERLWAEDGGEILRPAVELAWRRAEREASEEEVTQHMEVMQLVFEEAQTANNWQLCRLLNVLGILFDEPGSAARTLVFPHPMNDPESPPAPLLSPTELKNCCHLIREFFGTQGGPPKADPSWLTSTVLTLAEGIYSERAFDRLPILADALQDAGCDNEDILSHCRSEGPHVKGCWVVDLLLGKE